MKFRAELFDGEHVLAATRAHPRALLPAFSLLLLAVMLASFASTVYPSARVLGVIVLIAAVVALIKVARALLRYGSKQFFLTNYRVVVLGGAEPVSIGLTQIRSMSVQRKVAAAKYGDVLVRSQSGDYLLKGLGHPQKFSTLTYRAQQNLLGV